MSNEPLVCALVLIAVCSAIPVRGCPLCFGSSRLEPTLADDVRDAHDVVVANGTGEPDTLEIAAVYKGDAVLKGDHVNASDIHDAGPRILCRTSTHAPWASLGAAGGPLDGFVHVVLGLPATPPATDAEWYERLERFRPYLGDSDPRLARSALTEWARAPYRVLTAQHVDGEKLGAWLMNPAQADAQLMLSVMRDAFGGTNDTRHISDDTSASRTAPVSAPQTP
ncbi:MAG: hypothetical protein K8T26_01255 [Lentisphaerae bacterium]|nr:hypothetical protein [Lentisphaerota bacterium]